MHNLQKRLLKLAKREDLGQLGYRKLGEKIGVEHPQKVKHHLQKLINDGFLYRTVDGQLKVSTPGNSAGKMLSLPILGEANCGQPLAYADDTIHGYLKLSPSLVRSKRPGDLFIVKASGDSMNKARVGGKSINDGDYVVVDSSVEIPENGDYVVSTIEGLANIKCFKRDQAAELISLESQSTRPRPPIFVHPDDTDSYRIHGRVVDVIKAS
ncbi:MAG: S24 family peptidase [Candidatus Saccharimonadales bacterium]|nr:S24 family peptidase [Candidatus Saccharimonadales bacterium]